MTDPVHPDQPYTPSTRADQDASRRLKMKSTIEDVLIEILTQSFGPSLKAAQITLALEPQITELIASVRRDAQAEQRETDAVIAETRGCRMTDDGHYVGIGGHGIAAAIRCNENGDN